MGRWAGASRWRSGDRNFTAARNDRDSRRTVEDATYDGQFEIQLPATWLVSCFT